MGRSEERENPYWHNPWSFLRRRKIFSRLIDVCGVSQESDSAPVFFGKSWLPCFMNIGACSNMGDSVLVEKRQGIQQCVRTVVHDMVISQVDDIESTGNDAAHHFGGRFPRTWSSHGHPPPVRKRTLQIAESYVRAPDSGSHFFKHGFRFLSLEVPDETSVTPFQFGTEQHVTDRHK